MIPAKRDFHLDGATVNPLITNLSAPSGATGKRRVRPVDHATLNDLARTDPVTWGIVRMIRATVNSTPWGIVPDIDEELEELDRWYDQACDCINDWRYSVDFASSLLPKELVGRVSAEVRAILSEQGDDARMKRYRLETLFRVVKRELEQEAVVNCAVVRRLFDRPNNHWEKSLRALQEIVLKDLLIDDAGVVVHNYNVFGEIAELYRIPGWQVIPLSYPDLTVPQGNDAAYVWDDCGKVKGWFSNRELTYIMESPQGDGYGMSPVEALVYVTTATLLGDNVFIRNLKEGFIPPGILNLKDASDSERDRFESVLNAKLNRTQGNRFIVVSGVPSEDGEFQYTPIPQGVDFQKAQILEYLKMAPAVKAFVFGFQAADIGILMDGANGKASDSEVRAALVHRRGISSRLDLLEAYYNAEIIKQEFPFKNVRFKYVREIPVSDPLRIEQAYSVAINNGSMTRNEARKLRGQRPVPGGDVPTITTGNSQFQVDALEPASQDDDQCGEEGTDKTEGGVDPVFQARPKKRNDATERATMQGTRTTD